MIGRPTTQEVDYILANAQYSANEGIQQSGLISKQKAVQMHVSVLDYGGYYLVYRNNNQTIAGWILIGESGDQFTEQVHAFIYEIYVLPNYRKKGIGKVLLQSAMDLCKQRGYQEIRLNVFAKNSAKLIYERLGFEDVQMLMNKRLV
ncbi:GNAT family N-acetyltransferase [Radiobacillus sp. PE A8.2]|uniref:GNAT family N-acetyltransferase n=1 Tax=Radiobacillus sp. PE A8.2 TaxID=3380349 RepID=UPI00388DE82E